MSGDVTLPLADQCQQEIGHLTGRHHGTHICRQPIGHGALHRCAVCGCQWEPTLSQAVGVSAGVPAEAVSAALEALAARTATGQGGNRLSRDAAKWAAVVALEAAAPAIAAQAAAAERELLAEAADALWACAKAALTVKPTLDVPYPDRPEWTPWTRWMERPAREAHDLRMKIRKHLKAGGTDDK